MEQSCHIWTPSRRTVQRTRTSQYVAQPHEHRKLLIDGGEKMTVVAEGVLVRTSSRTSSRRDVAKAMIHRHVVENSPSVQTLGNPTWGGRGARRSFRADVVRSGTTSSLQSSAKEAA